jgi:hypothetical protein
MTPFGSTVSIDLNRMHIQPNPLISPPPLVIALGTPAILDYLRNPIWWYFRILLDSGASGSVIVATVILIKRWRLRSRYVKPKRQPNEA